MPTAMQLFAVSALIGLIATAALFCMVNPLKCQADAQLT